MLRQYHPMYLAMAREQLWRPDCFTENAAGGMPGFKYVEGNSGDLVIEWKHGQPNKEVKCGAAPGVSDAGCVRDALAIALRVYAPQDEAVHAEIKTWEAWVYWSHLPKRVESLNQVSAFNNVHSLMTLKEKDNLKLPVTRLGRSYLFEAGFRSLLLRPMAPVNGWSQHCIPLTASAAGVWSVHDPNEVVLLDAIPGVASLEGAYILRVRSRGGCHGHHYTGAGPPLKKVKGSRAQIPGAPTSKAAVDHLICTLVDRSFEAFAFESGLSRVESAGGMCRQFMDVWGASQKQAPVHLWLRIAKAHLSVPLQVVAYDPQKLVSSPAADGYFLVGCESKLVGSRVECIFLVRLAAHQVSLFCPVRMIFLKHGHAKTALGLKRSFVWAKQIVW